ncbi:MAG: APC family permease [Bacteroidales bacterium]
MTRNKQTAGKKHYKIGLTAAMAVVVANMVGTGVFTSLGFQVTDITDGFSLLLLWALGGVLALFGAFTYGELGAALPRNGGEYNFLTRIYHPLPGFLAGWVSIFIGFAAPIAAAALAMGDYSLGMLGIDSGESVQEKTIATIVVLLIGGVHLMHLKAISGFQTLFTLFKLILIAGLIVAGFVLTDDPQISFAPVKDSFQNIGSMPFAASLVWVMLAYSGWNAASYIVDDLRKPGKDLPRSLFIGTALVILLYVLLNAVFLYAAPISELAMKKDVGHVAARFIFGNAGGAVVSGLISFALISTISSMTWAGPRVSAAIGADMRLFGFLSHRNRYGIPHKAVIFQLILIVPMIWLVSFENLIEFTSVLLSIFSFLAVLGVFVLRVREPQLKRPYKAWGYPFTPAVFLLITGWMIVYFLRMKPEILIAILITLLAGTVFWFISTQLTKKLSDKTGK